MKNLLILSIFILAVIDTAIAQENDQDRKYVLGGNLNIARYIYNNPNALIAPSNNSNIGSYDNRRLRTAFHIGRKVSKNGIAGLVGEFEISNNHITTYTQNSEPNIQDEKSRK